MDARGGQDRKMGDRHREHSWEWEWCRTDANTVALLLLLLLQIIYTDYNTIYMGRDMGYGYRRGEKEMRWDGVYFICYAELHTSTRAAEMLKQKQEKPRRERREKKKEPRKEEWERLSIKSAEEEL